jgi:multidrug efflux pump subunit AcrA (membrane-fusion protein)
VKPTRAAIVLTLLSAAVLSREAGAQGVREHTRMKTDRSTAVSDSQAGELTLTLTEAAVRPIQIWVRTAGVTRDAGKTIAATLSRAEGAHVKVGQRVRAFPPESRSSMFQAWVTRVDPRGERGVDVTVSLKGQGREHATRYILEIVTEPLEDLSVPNEAIIESEGKRIVYVNAGQGRYQPREVTAGTQGELYTQVLDGLKPGEKVVTFGSFFIDADHKLKGL